MQVVSDLVVPGEGGALLDSPLVVSSLGVLLRAKDPPTSSVGDRRRRLLKTKR